jgi:DeoR/GlpR family transcriptional regulator of sugar metabolism
VLKQLLGMLEEGGIHTPAELADRLDVSERLVESMLADLSQMGYLRSVSGGPCAASPNTVPEPCADCPLSSACAVCEPGSQVWALTQKAFR